MKKQWLEHGAALILALLVLLALDRLTNRLDVVEGHAWDFVYYIDMAENGVWGNDHLSSPYAYRFLTPLIARAINTTLNTSTFIGFKVTSYLGLTATLWGLYLIGRYFKTRFITAAAVMLVPALALFNVKFLLFDFYRPDQLAYPLIVFSFLALLHKRWWIALILSVVGLLTREYPVIPLLIIVYESARRWLANKKDWRALVWIAACGVGAGLALGLPRALIPVTATQQILDPFLDPNFMNTLLTMPFDLRRDFNFIFNLIAYWMPLIILATPARLKKAWSDLGTYRAWILIYLAVNLVGMMYGGTDMMRYATYFFLPQALILIHVLKQEVHVFEALYVLGALAVFNRIFFLFPIWDFGLYLDFYGGYGDHINASSYLRFLELFGLIGLGIVLRTLIHERPRPASYYLNGPEIG